MINNNNENNEMFNFSNSLCTYSEIETLREQLVTKIIQNLGVQFFFENIVPFKDISLVLEVEK
jgi:uncharacterized protein YerC